MLGRIIECLMMYVPAVAYTAKLAANRSKKEKAIVVAILVCSLYWSLMYVLQQQWPSLSTLAELAFERPAGALIRYWSGE